MQVPSTPPGRLSPDSPDALEPAPGMSLRDWMEVVSRGRWLILAALMLVAVPVTVWALRQANQYQAYSVLLVETKDSDLASVLPGQAGRNLLMGENRSLENEALLLRQSLPLAERVAARLISLRRVPETREPIPAILGENQQVLTPREVALRLQSQYITVQTEGRDVDALRITASSTVPGEAALIANLFAEEYLLRTKESSRAGYTASREFLENQIGQQAESLEGQEAQMRAFMTREGAVNLDQESQQIVSQIATLQADRDQVAIEVQMQRATNEALRRELDGIEPRLSQRIASGVDRDFQASQTRLAEVEGRLETIYLQNPALRDAAEVRPEVAALRTQVETLQNRVRTLSQQLLQETLDVGGVNPTNDESLVRLNALRRQLVDGVIRASSLEAKERVLGQRVAEYEARVRRMPTQAIQLAQLQRGRQSTERLFLGLEEKLQEARVLEQSTLGYAEQVRPALRPIEPVGPNRPRNILLGVLLGLGLGLGVALMRTRMDHRMHSPRNLRDRGVPLLGVVPDMAPLVSRDFGGEDFVTVDGHRYDTHLTTLLTPLSAPSEAYRSIRTSLQYSRPDTPLRTVMVTSAMPSEGKSVSAANLAIALAQTGQRVLLVDADLRKPSIHRKLGRTREPGLSSLLFEEVTLEDPSFATDIDDLWIVPAGPSVPNPSELLGSRAMAAFLETARTRFDVVVVDTPPALMATDAVLLAPQADALILVVRAGQSKDFELDQALELLAGVHAPLVGAVLNGFDPRGQGGYGYQYQYMYYNSGYGYGDGAEAAGDKKRRKRRSSQSATSSTTTATESPSKA